MNAIWVPTGSHLGCHLGPNRAANVQYECHVSWNILPSIDYALTVCESEYQITILMRLGLRCIWDILTWDTLLKHGTHC